MTKKSSEPQYLDDKALIKAVREKLNLSSDNRVGLACAVDPSLIHAVVKGGKGLGPKARLKLWHRLGAPWAKDAFLHLFPEEMDLFAVMEQGWVEGNSPRKTA